MNSSVKKDARQWQQTIRESVILSGIGIHSGDEVTLKLSPLGPNQGVVFVRSDVNSGKNIIPATFDCVDKSELCTSIKNEYGIGVSTIEHLMAAFWASGIDNVRVDTDRSEVPIMDGSAAFFTRALKLAGVKKQRSRRKIIKILKEISVYSGDRSIHIGPFDDFTVDFEIDFMHKVIGRQQYHFTGRPESFESEISQARTFGFMSEVEGLKKMGLAKGASLENAIGLDRDGILNPGGLRYKDEFVRHKILDCLGDLYLAGCQIQGRVMGNKSGHAMNNEVLRKLFSDPSAYGYVTV